MNSELSLPVNYILDSNSCIASASSVSKTEATCNAEFKRKEYWEERFAEEEEYDWLLKFEDCQHYLLPHLRIEDRILILGCGNSSFSADLYDLGYHNITNIDFSSKVISNMALKHSNTRPMMKWICMDMTDLEFLPSSFDAIIDKAAMDALVVDEGDVWYPNQEVIDIVDKMCHSVTSVLDSIAGRFIQISFAQPHFRTKYLMGSRKLETVTNFYSADSGFSELYNWELLPHFVLQKETGCLNSFLYLMKKSN